MVIEKCTDWQLSSALHMIFQAQVIGPGEWQEGHGRPNFNPFLTGHHGIHRRRSQIIFHIKYFMLEKMRKKGSMDDKCDDQNLRGGGQHSQCCNQVFQEKIRTIQVIYRYQQTLTLLLLALSFYPQDSSSDLGGLSPQQQQHEFVPQIRQFYECIARMVYLK